MPPSTPRADFDPIAGQQKHRLELGIFRSAVLVLL
jgi:hypothetical protein